VSVAFEPVNNIILLKEEKDQYAEKSFAEAANASDSGK
jgi:hypothetical protein